MGQHQTRPESDGPTALHAFRGTLELTPPNSKLRAALRILNRKHFCPYPGIEPWSSGGAVVLMSDPLTAAPPRQRFWNSIIVRYILLHHKHSQRFQTPTCSIVYPSTPTLNSTLPNQTLFKLPRIQNKRLICPDWNKKGPWRRELIILRTTEMFPFFTRRREVTNASRKMANGEKLASNF